MWRKFYRPPQGACFSSVTAFQDCVSGTSGAQLPPMLCAQVSFSASDCIEDRKCLNSTWYNLRCVPTEDGQSECTCKVTGDYTEDFTLTETVSVPTADACKERIAACLAASSPSP